MNNNDSNDRDMERQLEQHFASGADKVPPTPDLWASLEGRLGEQDPKPVWAGIRDWAFPAGGFQWGAADCGHGSGGGRHSDSRLGRVCGRGLGAG